jgi:hypothetical protein
MVKAGETYRIQPLEGGVIHSVMVERVERVEFDVSEFWVVWVEMGSVVLQRTSLTSFERWRRCDQGYRLTLTEDQMRRIKQSGWTGGEAGLAEWLATAAEERVVWRLKARLVALPAQVDPIPDPIPDPVTDPQRGDVVSTWAGPSRVYARDGDRVAVETPSGMFGWSLAEWGYEVDEVITVGGAS